MKYLILLLAFNLSGCCYIWPSSIWGGCQNSKCYSTWHEVIGSYQIKPTTKTPKGVGVDVDLAKHPIDLQKLDQRLDAIDKCMLPLMQQYKDKSTWKPEWQCLRKEIEPIPLKRECLQIKVVDPVKSTCSDWEFMPDLAPQAMCQAKGLPVKPECPCRWRTVIHDSYKIISPPALYLWNVVEIMTGCSNFWASPFAACAML